MAKEVAKAKIVQIVFVTKGIYDLEEPVFITFYTSMKLKSFHITCFTSTVTMVLQIVTLNTKVCHVFLLVIRHFVTAAIIAPIEIKKDFS